MSRLKAQDWRFNRDVFEGGWGMGAACDFCQVEVVTFGTCGVGNGRQEGAACGRGARCHHTLQKETCAGERPELAAAIGAAKKAGAAGDGHDLGGFVRGVTWASLHKIINGGSLCIYVGEAPFG